ncbi:MAG TPA: UDP-2,3-diacylglucosamine diphosphatase LpxI [Terriglobales bacterium]|nr:UDP-2,3-diacylglucosamine diphosphatase LpxI [Terriglobales bacterium]
METKKKLGLIAGNGKFPLIFATEAKREGYFVVAVAHRGETDPSIEQVADRVDWVYVGQLGHIIEAFQRAGVSEAVMAGGIRKVRLFGNFRPDLRGARFLTRLKSREDDALLRGIAEELAADNIQILESTLCLSHIVAREGVMTKRAPRTEEWDDIKLGFRIAKEVGRLGIGQTVVLKNRVVIAVEAVEGTDAAIQRGGSLSKSGCVVIKVSKPHQDMRFDVPAVGMDTIKNLHAVKGAVLAVESGKTILLEKESLLELADQHGLSVVGIGPHEA